MRKAIDSAPRNGDFVILEDDDSGSYAVARWSAEAEQWIDDEGAPSQLKPTHWHPPLTIAALVGEIETPADPRSPANESPPGSVAAQPQRAAMEKRSPNARTESADSTAPPAPLASRLAENARAALVRDIGGKVPPANAATGGSIADRRRSILAMLGCLLAGMAIGPLLYHGGRGTLLLPRTAESESEAGLKHALRQEQELATRLASDATAARREAESQATSLRQASESASWEKEASDRTIVQLRQALQLELAKAEKLAGELAEAQRDAAVQASLVRKATDEAAHAEAERERITGELRQALKQQEDKAVEASVRAIEQVALKQEREKVEKLRVELAAARREGEAQAALSRAASDEAMRLKAASARAVDELRQALRQAQDRAEKLAGEVAAARQEAEARTAAARAAGDEARRTAETSKRSADEQGQALRDAQDKAERLGTELAAARREAQSQVSAAKQAKDQIAGAKEAAERSADEQRRALQQERDKVEKLAAELAAARSGLEMQTKAKGAEELARDSQLVAMRGELQKAKAEAAVARDSLEAERARSRRAEQQLATLQESTAGRSSRSPSAASSGTPQPATAPASTPQAPIKPAALAAPDNPQAVRLIARAYLLLEQGNISAARNMLDRAAEVGSTEALFWLAETYDPLLLPARQTVGTQSDIAKARELYAKALAGGMSEAKVRLEALQQRTGAR